MTPATARQPASVPVVALTILCFLVVAAAAPPNWVLGVLCWNALTTIVGWVEPDQGALGLLTIIAQTGVFTLLWLPVAYASRRKSPLLRCALVVVLTAVYLAFWAGVAVSVDAEMAHTGKWL